MCLPNMLSAPASLVHRAGMGGRLFARANMRNPSTSFPSSHLPPHYAVQAWVDAFFARANMRNPATQVKVVEPPMYNFLSRTNSTMHLTFTYDPDIKFHTAPSSMF